MEPKSGLKTTEFWVTAAVNIVAAVIAILAGRGLVTQQESELWVVLAQSLATAIAPIVMAIVSTSYIKSRGLVKYKAAGGGG